MGNEEKASKGLIILVIILSITLLTICGIVIGLYYEGKYSADDDTKRKGVNESILPKYERIETEKFYYGPFKRFMLRVLIDEEVSKQQLIEVSTKLVNEMIEERRSFQGLLIHYYSHVELINEIPALGTYTYAPNGRWGDVGEGKSDFSNFSGDTTELNEKNWEEKPTNQEIKMYQDYDVFEMRDDGIESVANKYNITFEEARDSINKIDRWIYK